MIYLLTGVIAVQCLIIIILLVRIAGIHKAADEIAREFAARLSVDTNVGIDISTSDRKMRRLAADIDRQLKLLRKAHYRYTQGDRELKEAITSISHDLRTPLTAICGYMDMLEQEEISEAGKEYLHIIDNRINALKQLMEELFRYSIITTVSQYTEREAVALNQVVEECVAAYYGALKECGIEPEIMIPEKRIVRELNRDALSRILGNVMSNAIKYSDGDLNITLMEDGRILFCNHAKQIDEVTVGRLFDRFYTVENGRNATGLGLSIAKTLTGQLGGEISAAYTDGRLLISIIFPQDNRN